MRKDLGTKSVNPVNPNVVLSADGTTLFVFEEKASGIDEYLLVQPEDQTSEGGFYLIYREGSYLHYDTRKRRWIRTGKISGLGDRACFEGCCSTRKKECKGVRSNAKALILPGVSGDGCAKQRRFGWTF